MCLFQLLVRGAGEHLIGLSETKQFLGGFNNIILIIFHIFEYFKTLLD